jgi:hypothetical protein
MRLAGRFVAPAHKENGALNSLLAKKNDLVGILRQLESVVVAYSGGG